VSYANASLISHASHRHFIEFESLLKGYSLQSEIHLLQQGRATRQASPTYQLLAVCSMSWLPVNPLD
jgi:hypothetical protein